MAKAALSMHPALDDDASKKIDHMVYQVKWMAKMLGAVLPLFASERFDRIPVSKGWRRRNVAEATWLACVEANECRVAVPTLLRSLSW